MRGGPLNPETVRLLNIMAEIRRKRRGTDKLPFARILEKVMKERGLSVGAIAEMAGVSRSVVQSWTANANPHDLQAVAKLAKALNIGFKELLLGEPESRDFENLTLSDLFSEQELFEGICRIKIERLVPKKGSGK